MNINKYLAKGTLLNFYGLHHQSGRDRIIRTWDPWLYDTTEISTLNTETTETTSETMGTENELVGAVHTVRKELSQEMSRCAYLTYGWVVRASNFPHLRCCRFCSRASDFPELTAVRNYFGQKTVSYFAWFMYHTHAMAILAVFGVAVEVFISLGHYVTTIETDAANAAMAEYGINSSNFTSINGSSTVTHVSTNYTLAGGDSSILIKQINAILGDDLTWVSIAMDYALIVWAIMVCVWATLVGEGWKRLLAELYCMWGVEDSDADRYVRPEFIGDLRVPSDPSQFADGRTTPKGNKQKRCMVYVLQIPVMCTCMFIVVFAWGLVDYLKVNVLPDLQSKVDAACTDNITGSVLQNNIFYNTTNGTEVLLPSCCGPATSACLLAKQEKDDYFSNDNLMVHGVTAVHSFVITLTNYLWGACALIFTNWENHSHDSDYEKSLGLKTFVFQFLNSYLSLFWFAFVKFDHTRLRTQLAYLMIFKQLSDYILYMVVPYIQFRYKLWSRGMEFHSLFVVQKKKGNKKQKKGTTAATTPIKTDAELARMYVYAQAQVEKDYIDRLKEYYNHYNPTMLYKCAKLVQNNLKKGGTMCVDELFVQIIKKYNNSHNDESTGYQVTFQPGALGMKLNVHPNATGCFVHHVEINSQSYHGQVQVNDQIIKVGTVRVLNAKDTMKELQQQPRPVVLTFQKKQPVMQPTTVPIHVLQLAQQLPPPYGAMNKWGSKHVRHLSEEEADEKRKSKLKHKNKQNQVVPEDNGQHDIAFRCPSEMEPMMEQIGIQDCMLPQSNIINFYVRAIMQFGYISLFGKCKVVGTKQGGTGQCSNFLCLYLFITPTHSCCVSSCSIVVIDEQLVANTF